jgi:hypothetical protein
MRPESTFYAQQMVAAWLLLAEIITLKLWVGIECRPSIARAEQAGQDPPP